MTISRMLDRAVSLVAGSRSLNSPKTPNSGIQFAGSAMASEHRYRNLVDNELIGIADVGVDGSIVYCNPTGLRMLDYYSLKEVQNKNVIELWHKPEQRKAFLSKLDQDGLVNNYRIDYVAKTGRIVHTMSSAIRDGDMICNVFIDISERTRAEQDLLISSEIIANVTDSVNVVREKDNIQVFSNPEFEKMFGYGEDELLGQDASVLSPLTGKEAEEAAREISESLGNAGQWEGETLSIRKDGSVFPAHTRISSFDHPDHGKVWVNVRSDITKRKSIESDNKLLLHDVGERLKELRCLHAISNSVASKKSIEEIFQDTVAAIPDAWQYPEITCSKLRYQENEWVSVSFEETEWKQSADIRVAGKRCGSVEIYYLEERPTLDEGPFTSDERSLVDNIAHTLGESIELNRAEERLQESRALFDSYLSVAPAGMAILDNDSRYVNLNEELANMNGVSIAEHLGKLPSEVLPGELGKIAEDQILEILRTGLSVVNEEISGETPSEPGVTRHWLRSMFPVYGAHQDIKGVGAMVIETTEAKRFEEQLRQSQKIEALGILASGIAHDINNMLYPIFVNTELLLEKCGSDSEEEVMLADIIGSAHQAKDLVSQILLFGRRREGAEHTCDFVAVAKEAMKLVRPALPETISIELDLSGSAIPVLCDSSQLYQVVVNLFTNAEQAISESGEVRLSLDTVDIEELECTHGTLLNGRFGRLAVSDNGVGMHEATLARIFDPFYTTKRQGQGTGLGLSTVFGIIQNHGGGITVSSELGTGSTFEIYLPLVEGTLDEPRGKTGVSQNARNNENIIFVDDVESIRMSTKVCLERSGYRVSAVSSGLEALEMFQADPEYFDLVITDQTMPEMTGKELSIRLLRLRPDIPIIISTGHSEHITPESVGEIGIRAFLQKPPSPEELRRVVRQVLDDAESG